MSEFTDENGRLTPEGALRAWKDMADEFETQRAAVPIFLTRQEFLLAAELGVLAQFGPVIAHPEAIREATARGWLDEGYRGKRSGSD